MKQIMKLTKTWFGVPLACLVLAACLASCQNGLVKAPDTLTASEDGNEFNHGGTGAEVDTERRTRQEHGPGRTGNPDLWDGLPQLLRPKPGQREFLRPLRRTHPSRERRLLQLLCQVAKGRPILSRVRGACRHPHGIVPPGRTRIHGLLDPGRRTVD